MEGWWSREHSCRNDDLVQCLHFLDEEIKPLDSQPRVGVKGEAESGGVSIWQSMGKISYRTMKLRRVI